MSNVYPFVAPAQWRNLGRQLSKPTSPSHRFGIDIKKTWEVAFWATTLGVSEEKLRAAVEVVGPQVAALRLYLKANVTSKARAGATVFSIATPRSIVAPRNANKAALRASVVP
jgi:hypothetical protein